MTLEEKKGGNNMDCSLTTEGDLGYSFDGKINRVIFYTDYNDVNIFVEDEGKEFEYEIIFRRLFGNTLKIATIFPVGGKQKLIDAFNLYSNGGECNSVNVFIADLDFDYVLDNTMIKANNFIYLDKYNIENYLIDEYAVVKFIQGRICKLEDETRRIVKYNDWLSKITHQLYDVYLLFLIVQDRGLGIENTGMSIFKLLKDGSWEVDNKKVQKYFDELSRHVPNLAKELVNMEDGVKEKVGDDFFNIINGKHYFDSLKKYLLNFSGAKIIDKDLRHFLFLNFDINKLDFLKESILNFYKEKSIAS